MNQITREQMLQVFENRCSTRCYDPNKKISQEDFAAILEFARLSPLAQLCRLRAMEILGDSKQSPA